MDIRDIFVSSAKPVYDLPLIYCCCTLVVATQADC